MMIGNILVVGIFYVLMGLGIVVFGAGDAVADEDPYVAFGMFLLWPLYVLKWTLLLIGYALYGVWYVIRHYGHKWFVVPVSIGKVVKRTGLNLFGKYKPSHYRDPDGNIILVNSRTGIEVESGKQI